LQFPLKFGLILSLTLATIQLSHLNCIKVSLPSILHLPKLLDPCEAVMKKLQAAVPLSLLLDPLLIPLLEHPVDRILEVHDVSEEASLSESVYRQGHLSPLIFCKKKNLVGSFDEFLPARPQAAELPDLVVHLLALEPQHNDLVLEHGVLEGAVHPTRKESRSIAELVGDISPRNDPLDEICLRIFHLLQSDVRNVIHLAKLSEPRPEVLGRHVRGSLLEMRICQLLNTWRVSLERTK